MDAALPISVDSMDEMLSESMEKVFTTMLQAEVTLTNTIAVGPEHESGGDGPPLLPEGSLVVGSVGFIGAVNGVIYVFLQEALALSLTGTLLGLEVEELQAEGHETINDALGELTNMIVGSFKNQLCDAGFNCRLTVPSILRGNSFAIETTSQVVQRVYQFEVAGKKFAAELFLKPGE